MGVYISRIWGQETPKPIWIKFGILVDVPDIITYTNFGDHRLRGFWVARGQIFPSPIDFHRRPYNTLAHNFWFCGMVFGVGQVNYTRQIWLRQTLVAMLTKICDF